MFTVIGLGGVGCKVAKHFDEYPQYNVVYVDDEKSSLTPMMTVKKRQKPEEYEEEFKTIPKRIKDKIKDDVIVVLSGCSSVSSISLRFLHAIKQKNVTIVYVRPELDLLDEKKQMQEKVIYSVLQEYTRSGLFEMVYLFENQVLDKVVENASIKDYYPSMNSLIVSTFHMLKVFEHQEQVIGNFQDINPARRICTLGILDMKTQEETLFFNLSEKMSVRMYYGISQETLNQDRNLQRSIINLVKDKNEELCRYSYGVYETQYDSDFCYVKAYSSKVQDF